MQGERGNLHGWMDGVDRRFTVCAGMTVRARGYGVGGCRGLGLGDAEMGL